MENFSLYIMNRLHIYCLSFAKGLHAFCCLLNIETGSDFFFLHKHLWHPVLTLSVPSMANPMDQKGHFIYLLHKVTPKRWRPPTTVTRSATFHFLARFQELQAPIIILRLGPTVLLLHAASRLLAFLVLLVTWDEEVITEVEKYPVLYESPSWSRKIIKGKTISVEPCSLWDHTEPIFSFIMNYWSAI